MEYLLASHFQHWPNLQQLHSSRERDINEEGAKAIVNFLKCNTKKLEEMEVWNYFNGVIY